MMAPSNTADTRLRSGRDLRQSLAQLTRIDRVRGGLVVAPDGLVIASHLPASLPQEALSALAATLGRELERPGPGRSAGTFVMAQFAAEDGAVFLGGTPVGFVVLITGADVDGDALCQALRGVIDAIQQAWQR